MSSIILSQVIIMVLLMFVGWVLSKSGKLPDEQTLVGLLMYASLPAMILRSVQVPLTDELLTSLKVIIPGFAVVLACGMGMGFIVGRLARQPVAVSATWAAAAGFPNVIFMGWPFKYAVFGDAARPFVPIVSLMFNVFCFTAAVWLLSMEGTSSNRPDPKKLLYHPVTISCVIGAILLFTPARLPGPILGVIDMIAMTTTPVAMVLIGSQLSKCSLRDTLLDGRVYLASFARLVPGGLAAYFLLNLFIQDQVIVGFLTIGALMPTATFVPVIAAQQGGDVQFCSKVAFLTTILSLVTLPLLLPLLL